MELKDVLKLVVDPGLAMLPKKMDSKESRILLLTIGQQESRFEHRAQIGGPAKGFYQFENGGGVRGVINHHSTRKYALSVLKELEIDKKEAYYAIQYNDVLATVFARLLLYSVPKPLPKPTDDPDAFWNYYIEGWRPGHPHRETFDAFLLHSKELLK